MSQEDIAPLVREHSDVPAHFLHGGRHGSPRLPHAIAHRGFKGQYPENTLCAVDGAVRAGSHAIEVDLHLSRDGVVVLSHDGSLERCFGVKKEVKDCDWAELKTLRTIEAPHDPMPRLVDLLEYLRQPGREHVWVVLDIKLGNDLEAIMSRIAKTIASVPIPAAGPDWHRRIVLGCWSAQYLAPRGRYLPRYEVVLICFDVSYARQFFQVPRVSFSIHQKILMGPLGRGFLEEARAARRCVYVWTVNTPNLMRWSIRHGVDGVITDEPRQYLQVSEQWEKEQAENSGTGPHTDLDRLTLTQRLEILGAALYVLLFGWFLKRRYLATVERVQFEEHKNE